MPWWSPGTTLLDVVRQSDLPSPPVLLTVNEGGRPVDAVAQATKQGFMFLFDRVGGQPPFPIDEKRFPAGAFRVATRITCSVGGQQFVVIAADGARDPAGPQGSPYVAFALPERGARPKYLGK